MMLASRIARALLVLGVVIGAAGVAAFVLDLRINFPDWMIRVAMIKLVIVASLGLFGAGALLGRHASRRSALQQTEMDELDPSMPDLRLPRKDGEAIRRESEL